MSAALILSKLANAVASKALRSRPPFLADCAGYHLLGADAASSVLNRVNPAKPLVAIGAPTFGANYARCDYANGYRTTDSFGTHAVTTIIVCTDPRNAADTAFGANSLKFMSMNGGAYFHYWPAASERQFWTGGGNGVRSGAGGDIPSIGADNAPGAAAWNGLFRFIAGCDTGGAAQLTVLDGAALKQFSGTSGPSASSQIKFCGDGFAADAVSKVAAIAYYSRSLTFAELGEVWAFIRSDIEARGIRT